MNTIPNDAITVQSAAKILGISSQRVRQLCESGQIDAVIFGNQWAISLASVKNRKKSSPKAGRPVSQSPQV
jgi:excisionase family DNA binding protein